MAFADDEAHLKALGLVNFWFAASFAYWTAYFTMLSFQIAEGAIRAPWMQATSWNVVIRSQPLLAMLATAAGFGLYRRRSWALRVELVFALTFAAITGLWMWQDLRQGRLVNLLFSCMGFVIFYCLPMTILFRPGCSTVLSDAYQQVVQETPYIRVRPKAPRALKKKFLIAGLIWTLAAYALQPS